MNGAGGAVDASESADEGVGLTVRGGAAMAWNDGRRDRCSSMSAVTSFTSLGRWDSLAPWRPDTTLAQHVVRVVSGRTAVGAMHGGAASLLADACMLDGVLASGLFGDASR